VATGKVKRSPGKRRKENVDEISEVRYEMR
jgi:hypothetical protein